MLRINDVTPPLFMARWKKRGGAWSDTTNGTRVLNIGHACFGDTFVEVGGANRVFMV